MATPARRRRGRITADDDEDDDDGAGPAAAAPPGRVDARRPRGHGHPVPGRRRAGARREARQKRSVAGSCARSSPSCARSSGPGRRELITYTTVVIVFVAFIVALVAGLDLLFAKGVIAVFG